MNLKNVFLALIAFQTISILGAERPPQAPKMPTFRQAALKPALFETLPEDIKREMLLINAQRDGVLNISALANGIIDLSATNPRMRAAINNPQNMIAIFKSLPTNAAAIYLALKLGNMASIKSKEVQDWLANLSLAHGRELFDAIFEDNKQSIAQLLLNRNIDLNWQNPHGSTPLIVATFQNDIESVRFLLANGANPNTIDKEAKSALTHAAFFGFIDIVKLLLAAGANPNIQNKKNKSSPLIEATRFGRTEIVKLLLAAHANPDIQDSRGITALIYASGTIPYTQRLKLLLDAGANPNIQNNNGDTALIWAVQGNRPKIIKLYVQLLLDAGADPDIVNRDGKTARALALEKDFDEIVKMLDEASARKKQERCALM